MLVDLLVRRLTGITPLETYVGNDWDNTYATDYSAMANHGFIYHGWHNTIEKNLNQITERC